MSPGDKQGKKRDMEAKASKHASKRVHACARVRARACVRVRARARGLMAALPGGGPAEDGSELRSHACGVAKVETRGVNTEARCVKNAAG